MSLLAAKGKSSPWQTIILVVITVILTLLLANKIQTCNRAKPTGEAPDSVRYWMNEHGKQVASLRGAMEDFGVQNQRLTDSMAQVYTRRIKDLKEYIIADIETHSEIPYKIGSTEIDYHPPTVIGKDTCPPEIRNIAGTFQSDYYMADVQLGEDPWMKLVGYDTLTVVWKDTTIGKFLNRKKYLQLDVSLANPDTRVTGLKSYRIPQPKPKRWAIGFTGGYGVAYDLKTQKVTVGPQIGLGVTRTFIRF